MSVLLLTFQLTRPEERYDEFFEALHTAANGREITLFGGCVLLPSTMSPIGLRRRLIEHLHPLDFLFICTVEREACAGKLSQRAKDWLKAELFWSGREEE